MNFFLETIDRWSYKILEIFKRFPLALFSSFVVTLLLIVFVEVGSRIQASHLLLLNKLAMVFSLGIFLFPALHLLSKKIWFKMAGIGLLLLYFYYLPENVLSSNVVVLHFLFIFALSFMFLWAPFMDIKISNQNIWEWTQTILENLLVSLILALAVFVIFFVTLYALKTLFLVDVHERHYLQFLLFLVGVFSVTYFLAKIPKFIMLVQKNKYNGMGVVFTKYILTPSFLIYFLILSLYIVKLSLQHSWGMKNIDLLALGYVFVAIGTYMHWTPLWEKEVNKKFRVFIWGSMFLLSLVLIYSIYLRAIGSSFESYYLMLLFTVWLALVSLYFLLVKEASYKWIFFSISLLIVFSQSEQLLTVSLDLYEKAR
ncbi:MAG TPA: DUF4153 domain-containing protein [Arcobacter sp.]|nr:DUF4153 domain-containing protein [Arcobacter sp.]